MKELIEEDEILPVRVRGVTKVVTMAWAMPTGIRKEETGDPPAEVLADLEEIHPLPRVSRILDLQVISVVEIVSLQAFDDEEVDYVEEQEVEGEGEEEKEEGGRGNGEAVNILSSAEHIIHSPGSHIGPLQLLFPPNKYELPSPGT